MPNLKAGRLGLGSLPAPPQDASGHTCQHPERVLREIILRGPAAVAGNGHDSDVPGFEGLLTEAEVAVEVEAILDYLKSEWPERERAHRARVTAADEAAGG